ncbi:MAG: hypothetical protein V1722_02675 [Candidatus Micrarchaeota archaeon]
MLSLFLLLFAEIAISNFTGGDMGCWAVSQYYFMSQPIAIDVDIPENYTNASINVGQGPGNNYFARLRKCAYYSCTNYQYYNSVCPVVASVGFGENNLSRILTPGKYRLLVDSLEGYAATKVSGAVLKVSFPAFTFDAAPKQCTYGDKTLCSVNAVVTGTSVCKFSTNATIASVTNAINSTGSTDNITFSFQNNSLQWNCTTGNYFIRLEFPALRFSNALQLLEFSKVSQAIQSTVTITNPAGEDFENVSFQHLLSPTQSFTNLSANSTANFSQSFTGDFVNSSSIVSSEYNFSGIGNVVVNISNTLLNFSFNATHNFSNWTATNTTIITVNFNLDSPVENLFVKNASEFFSQLFNTSVAANPNEFVSQNSTLLLLNGDFVKVTNTSAAVNGGEELNYSLSFFNPTNSSLALPFELDVSPFENVTLLANSTPVEINGGKLSVLVSNQSNFSIFVKQKTARVEITIPSSGIASSSGAAGAAGVASVRTFDSILPTDILAANNSVRKVVPTPSPRENNSSAVVEPIGEIDALPTSGRAPSIFSGFAVFALPEFSPFFFLPFALLIGGFLFLKNQRKTIVRLKGQQNKNECRLVVINIGKEDMCNVVLQEILPLNAKVKAISRARKAKTVIGVVLTWRRKVIAPNEKLIVVYNSSLSAKKGKLSFKIKDKLREVVF